MEKQNLSNHSRVHPIYHYGALPVSLVLIVAASYNAVVAASSVSILILAITIILHLVVFLTRDYAKKNQDRIIRAELRLRYHRLANKDFELIEPEISKDQLVALRFAGDQEFVDLIERAKLGRLTATEIKNQIKEWKPDMMRV